MIVFNASDPSGAGGIAADMTAIASVGAQPCRSSPAPMPATPAKCSTISPSTRRPIAEQARAILEDVPVQVFKVGFVGSPEAISTIAEIAADYAEVPVIAYMPNLSWWDEGQIDLYHDAFRELMLPQTTVLVGNHSTLWRWLLPEWSSERSPTARDIAKAASEMGVPYTLVTGMPLPDQFIDNVLATPQAVLGSEKFERFEAVFSGAGDTLSAALAALVASGTDLVAAATEALAYLDRCLDAGFRPGMGNVVPDRLFWAQPEGEADELTPEEAQALQVFDMPRHMTRSTDPRRPKARCGRTVPWPPEPERRSLFERARLIPGGVNSPVRAFRAVGGTPRFVQRAQGAYFWDANGKRYIDYIGSWGPMILGHGHPRRASRRCSRPCAKASPSARRPSAKIELAEEIVRTRALDGDGAPGELGHRGGDERDPAGARRHRPQQAHQVRGLLSRPRRRAAGEGRLRPGDLRQSRPARACRPRWCSTRWCSNTTTWRSWKRRSRCTARTSPA